MGGRGAPHSFCRFSRKMLVIFSWEYTIMCAIFEKVIYPELGAPLYSCMVLRCSKLT